MKMRRDTMLVAAVVAGAMMGAGCASDGKAQAASDAYKAFITQQRTYNSVHVVAAPNAAMTISMTGVGEVTLGAPLEPLSAMPKDPSLVSQAISAAEKVVLGGIGLGVLGEIATQEAPAPTVVEQQVLVPIEGAAAP